MPLRESLAATLRLVRISRGLTKDDFQGAVDSKHVYNIENARSSVTLDTLELLASVLEVDALTLITVAASLDRGLTHAELLKHLGEQGELLAEKGVLTKWASQFQDGALIPMEAGRKTPLPKVEAIQACRARGLNQKETAAELGLSTSTVSRNWNKSAE
ncbi:helix-turn-helix domain-containing protein [Pseudomonas juntendi]|uniref:helix-turn-helix domain-containing protein n=1 Tax=Pseudomonas juntendi TaxID=2666183 RepID=UPI00320901F1